MKKEIWKGIKGWEEYYQVSNLGRIKSLDRKILIKRNRKTYQRINKSRFLKFTKRKNYYLVSMFLNGVRITKSVHRLALETFVRKCPKGKEGCHLDGNSLNNILPNLKWGTPKENTLHKLLHGNITSSLSKKDVLKIRKLVKQKTTSQADMARMFKVSLTTINRIINRKTWSHIP